jgi:multiple sugar transport system permease protein
MRYYRWYTPYLFILPMLTGLLLFRIGPIITSLIMSFTDWNIRTNPTWIGLANYAELLGSRTFWLVLGNTFVFAGVFVPATVALGLLMALLVNQKLRGIAFFRGLLFMPYITSMVAVALGWNWIFSTRFGVLNSLLEMLPGVSRGPAWLADSRLTLWVLMIVSVWKSVGFQMMVFLAGLQGIPQDIVEAARIDGANRRQLFWHITLPLLSPVTFFVIIITIIDAFKTFEVTYTMTQGGPRGASSTLAFFIYQNAFVFQRMGYASSAATVLVILIALITIINFAVRRRWVAQQVS